MSGRPNQLPHVNCPACGGRAFARSTGKSELLFREVYYACRNPDACGHTFVIEMVAVRTIKPSRFPKPLHLLPMSTWRSTPAHPVIAAIPANENAVNDNGPAPEPIADTAPT
jgi:hypothetical protein